jgi:hypothetical protein
MARAVDRPLAGFHVHTKDLPAYRFVDVYLATEAFCRERGSVVVIESEHGGEDLNSILHSLPQRWMPRRIKGVSRTAWPVGPGKEAFHPADSFWLSRSSAAVSGAWLVLRVQYQAPSDRVLLEVAAEDSGAAQATVEQIVAIGTERSIYRGRLLSMSFEAGIKDEYGDVERPDRLRMVFRPEETVEDDDIVIDEDVRAVLWRNIVDLYRRRDVLKAHGVPLRRGLLLYGPPGTGKTFTCRYVCGKLQETTRIIVAGNALLQVKSIFNLARMLQPSLVILEDVDLVFAARDINLYSSVLGELLDQMDGLRPYEEVGVVLTTNAIDRLEAAIKDRPGRISQCVYLGPPSDRLRGRYLHRYLRAYDTSNLDLAALVDSSRGATPAFLKEWVHRAVQMATERLAEASNQLVLRNGDFEGALREMRRFSEGSTGRIIGFHGE